ncbi:CcgAII protein [Salmonella enterica]|nr:CcgAII protein [Salmonella enterica]ECR9149898.1 CcgAII protein [Salmonella enterica]EFU0771659.1 CcgAII protein [Salmonella enterica]EFV9842221.1 CcgAII protein [Salmonella enterica]EIL0568890.1 CcgAII protein [Salmonella enterica]
MTYSTIDQCLTAFREQCTILASKANAGCGLIYELYQRRLSAAIDGCLETVPTQYRPQAVELARREFDYLSQAEIEEEIRQDSENGICCHGIDRDCCPCGCGDIDDDWPC